MTDHNMSTDLVATRFDDRMPPQKTHVLAFNIHNGQWHNQYYGSLMAESTREWFKRHGYTHWAPMPEPPND